MEFDEFKQRWHKAHPATTDETCLAGCDPDDFEDDDDEEEASTESDLTDCLDHLNQLVRVCEEIIIKGGKIKKIPDGFHETMEAAAEFLDQWDFKDEPDRSVSNGNFD